MPVVKKFPTQQKPLPKRKPRNDKPKPTSTNTGWWGVIYGPSGVGKTSLAAAMPDVEFIHDERERGIHSLMEFGQVDSGNIRVRDPITSWEQLLEELDNASGSHLALDSTTGFQQLCYDFVGREEFGGNMGQSGFMNYFAGPLSAAKFHWPRFLDKIHDCTARGINVLLIAHSELAEQKNPLGPNYDAYTPFLEKRIWQETHRMAQFVLFYNYYIDVTSDRKDMKGKASGGEDRFLHTEYSAGWAAKNQMGLPSTIDAGSDGKEGWGNLIAAIEKAKS